MTARLILGALVAVAAATMAGCAGPEIPDVRTDLPSSGTSRPNPLPSVLTRAVPPVTHKWRTSGLSCPHLTDSAASALGIRGVGRVTESTDVKTVGNSIDCRWGPGDGTASTVSLHLSTSTSQAGADAEWQILSAALPVPLNGVGEQAFISADTGSDSMQAAVRSGNANLDIRLTAKKGDAKGKGALRDAAAAIAADMLGSLVPA
ncbi:hypothetical protein [Krasilnikovia sp. MM14-A1004]|uniref:hypothetical protein n=1 Tax=Krasilnikovia sp. MM14-A1004 TaxID=3373541 RepID=UPI00399C5975